jgi:hypothetical protein
MTKDELVQFLLDDFEKTMKPFTKSSFYRLKDMLNLLNIEELNVLKDETEKQQDEK